MLHNRSIERAAQHEAKRTEQKAKGELERQKLQNEKVIYPNSMTIQFCIQDKLGWCALV